MSTNAPPPSNREAVQKLAALVCELAERDEFQHLMYYSHLIATLQDFHDRLAELKPGSPDHYMVYGGATKIWNAARNYAREHGFDDPNSILRECGYQV